MTNTRKEEVAMRLIERIFKPFVLSVYAQAGLVVPKDFDAESEAAMIVATLRTQGFNAKFPVVKGGTR